jgi:hypothetical protein
VDRVTGGRSIEDPYLGGDDRDPPLVCGRDVVCSAEMHSAGPIPPMYARFASGTEPRLFARGRLPGDFDPKAVAVPVVPNGRPVVGGQVPQYRRARNRKHVVPLHRSEEGPRVLALPGTQDDADFTSRGTRAMRH